MPLKSYRPITPTGRFTTLNQSPELSKKRPSAIRALAQCLRALKKYDAAITRFEEYLATKPTPADADAIKETIRLLQELRLEQDNVKAKEAVPPAATAPPVQSTPPLATEPKPPPPAMTEPPPPAPAL